MAEDLGERTEEATSRRREDAREDGRVAKSQDVVAVALLCSTAIALAATIPWGLNEGGRALTEALQSVGSPTALDADETGDSARLVLARGAMVAAPVLAAAFLAAILSQLAQFGFLFSPKAASPRLSKLDPLKNAQRIIGLQGLVRVLADIAKVTFVTLIAVRAILDEIETIVALPLLPLVSALERMGEILLGVAMQILVALLVLALLDLIFQRWKLSKDLRMTKQEVRDELKQTDGDPETKRRRMRMQQQIINQRISAAVPKADVIVTNPEHISIAIAYDADTMKAPRVVAKGADHLALRIRQIAMNHGIPIVERKPLARALYKGVQTGQEIPADFYAAVAEVLAFVYRLGGRRAG